MKASITALVCHLTCWLALCSSIQVFAQVVVNDSADKLVTLREFRYKELDESWLDSTEAEHPEWLFDNWTLQEIINAGGTIQTERSIRAQIGKKLIVNADSIYHEDFFTTVTIHRPKYGIASYAADEGPSLKGSTYWMGYRPLRDRVYYLKVDDNEWFEVISLHEMATYYDGRIYIFEKD